MHEDNQSTPPAGRGGSAVNRRSLITGFVLVCGVAALAPVNDWLLHNTFLYSQHLPVGVFLLLVVVGVVVNPSLGRHRYRANELMVVIAMLLVLGGVVSSGLTAYFPAVVSGPAKILATSGELAAFVDAAGDVQLPHGAYVGLPERGVPDSNSPEYRRVIEGFHHGAAEKPASIPWRVWGAALLAWTPLIGSAMVCFLCIAALVRHQWMNNERLAYPIAEVITGFLQDPEPGRRLAPVFRTRAFWAAFTVAALVLGAIGLKTMGLLPFALPTEISLWRAFNFPPFNQGYAPTWIYLTPTIYFSIIGLTFFLPSDLSFSLWFCFIFGNAVYALLQMQGVPVDSSMPARVSMGGWFVECLLILWVGRRYYLSLLRTAFTATDEPHLREVRPFTWAFLASAAGLVVSMVVFGAGWGSAVIAALCYLGVGLVLARLVAEAGIPFIQTPLLCNTLIYSLTGLAAPIAALVPLTMLGQTLSADPREHLLPFAANAEYLAAKAGVPRIRWAAIALLVLGVGTLLSGMVMLWCAYGHGGQQELDSWWKSGPLMSSLGPVANQAQGGVPVSNGTTYGCYGVGALLTGGLGMARLAWSWWPIHPIGILVCACYPTYKIWFSFFLGWLIKTLVMRYGGVQLYKRLKPAAMGLIAAEAVIAGLFLIVALVAGLCGMALPSPPQFLPG